MTKPDEDQPGDLVIHEAGLYRITWTAQPGPEGDWVNTPTSLDRVTEVRRK